jgi:hypothetical protein
LFIDRYGMVYCNTSKDDLGRTYIYDNQWRSHRKIIKKRTGRKGKKAKKARKEKKEWKEEEKGMKGRRNERMKGKKEDQGMKGKWEKTRDKKERGHCLHG